MKFSEEYKSAMNEISPDEKTTGKIERAVMEKISVPAKKKKPFYVYAGAFSGAAACIALACFVLVKVNTDGLKSNAAGGDFAPSFSNSIALKSEESYSGLAGGNAPTDMTNEAADIPLSSSMDLATKDNIHEYNSSAQGEGFEAPALPQDTVSENCASVPKDAAEQEYAITFRQDGSIVIEGNGINAEFRPDGAVTHYSKPQQDLSCAKTRDGELYFIRLESNYLYIFEDDMQTAECYKLK